MMALFKEIFAKKAPDGAFRLLIPHDGIGFLHFFKAWYG